jgi:divalent metal cation (Fe/Co/Zn/Cd) transporter
VLDPIAAGVVSVGIFYTGVEIVRDNVGYLVGAAPPEDLRREILERALDHPQVRGAHDVVAHYVGPEVDVSLHIEVEGHMSLFEAHDIESEVVESIQSIPEVDDVFVHVDPKELGEWKADDDADPLDGAAVAGEGSAPSEAEGGYDSGNRKRDTPDGGGAGDPDARTE